MIILAIVMLALGAYVLSRNSRYLSNFNINSVEFACAALGFISLGQTFALLYAARESGLSLTNDVIFTERRRSG